MYRTDQVELATDLDDLKSGKAPHVHVDKVLHFAFVGDLMFDRGVLFKIQNASKGEAVLDFDFPLALVKDRLSGYDMTFGNLEGPVSSRGANRGSIYSFRMNPEVVTALAGAGFDVLSVANNHIGDWGTDAMIDTLSYLSDSGIIAVGGGLNREEVYSPKYFKINNGDKVFTVGFIGASEFGKGYTEAKSDTVGIAVLDANGNNSELVTAIKKAKSNADLVVVSLHFGEEYKLEPNKFQRLTAESFIDAGADIVVGHHPHVLEPVEEYVVKANQESGKPHKGLIAYSMGNFVFDQYFSKETMSSAILEVDFDTGSKTYKWRLVPIKINKNFQPEVLSE